MGKVRFVGRKKMFTAQNSCEDLKGISEQKLKTVTQFPFRHDGGKMWAKHSTVCTKNTSTLNIKLYINYLHQIIICSYSDSLQMYKTQRVLRDTVISNERHNEKNMGFSHCSLLFNCGLSHAYFLVYQLTWTITYLFFTCPAGVRKMYVIWLKNCGRGLFSANKL